MAAEEGLLTDVEVLKVGHHGSNTSTGDAFLPGVLLMSSSPAVSPWDQGIRPYWLRCQDHRGTLEYAIRWRDPEERKAHETVTQRSAAASQLW
jgi:hypothetical protein